MSLSFFGHPFTFHCLSIFIQIVNETTILMRIVNAPVLRGMLICRYQKCHFHIICRHHILDFHRIEVGELVIPYAVYEYFGHFAVI